MANPHPRWYLALLLFGVAHVACGGHTARPVVSSLSPVGAAIGGPAFMLSVAGSGFAAGSRVTWNGSARTSSRIDETGVTTMIYPSDVSVADTALVGVIGPDGSTSNTMPFPITALIASALSPSSATAGGPGFTLTVIGTGFFLNSSLTWNSVGRSATTIDESHLTTLVFPADIANPGIAQIQVIGPAGGSSNALPFTIAAH